MTYSWLDWLLALAPVLAVLLLMVLRSWPANRAGLVGWGLALGLAAWRFEAGARVLEWAQVEALLLTADVLIIIWAALLLYTLVDRAGALRVLADALAGLTRDRTIQTLLLGWVFASFLQGVGGFGVPVAITAPLLIGLGVPQVRAVVIPALGHSWAVTFGSLATSFIMLINLSGMAGEELASQPALMLGILCYVTALMAAHALAGWRGMRRALPYVLVTGTAMSSVQYVLAVNGLWTIGAIGGGLAGLAVSVIWIRAQAAAPAAPDPVPAPESDLAPAAKPTVTGAVPASPPDAEPETPPRPVPSLRLAMAGYGVLVVLALLLRGIAPVKDFLAQWALAVDLPETSTGRDWTVPAAEDEGFGIPGHPGLIILYSCAVALALYLRAGHLARRDVVPVVAASLRRAWKSGVGIFLMVSIAATMARAGMIAVLAQGLSDAVPGDLYPFVAPLIGAIGAFVTGSNANSNAVFTELQQQTAGLLDLPVLTILAAQTAAASVISVMSPAKVTVGCSTVGANEGRVLRWLLGYGVIVVLLIGVMAWVAARLA